MSVKISFNEIISLFEGGGGMTTAHEGSLLENYIFYTTWFTIVIKYNDFSYLQNLVEFKNSHRFPLRTKLDGNPQQLVMI